MSLYQFTWGPTELRLIWQTAREPSMYVPMFIIHLSKELL